MAVARTASTKTRGKRSSGSWTIKGVSSRTRSAVTKAARQENMTIGAWVNKALSQSAQETLQDAPSPHTAMDDVLQAIDSLTKRFEAFVKETAPTQETLKHVRQSLEDLGTQASDLTERTIHAASPAAERVVDVVEKTFEDIVERMGFTESKSVGKSTGSPKKPSPKPKTGKS